MGQFVPSALFSLVIVQALTRHSVRNRLTMAWIGMTLVFITVFMPSRLLMNFFGRFQFMVLWPLVLVAAVSWGRTTGLRRPSPFVPIFAAALWLFPQVIPVGQVTSVSLSYFGLVRAHGVLGNLLHDSFPRDTVVMMGDVGLAPYLSDLTIVDSVGLALPHQWRKNGPTMEMEGVDHGVIVLVAKSADPMALWTNADGSHGIFDTPPVAAWAIEHGYRDRGYVTFFPGYHMHLWLSPSLQDNARILEDIQGAQCQSQQSSIPGSLSEVLWQGFWPLHPSPSALCG